MCYYLYMQRVYDWLIQKGLVRDTRQAELAIAGAAIVIILISIFLMVARPSTTIPPQAQEHPETGYIPYDS